MRRPIKLLEWHPDAKKRLMELPEAVRREFGHELYLIQTGAMPENASPFEGSQGNDILKLVERFDGDTYRCVFAAKLETAIYVLHVYMKKANEGKKTPKHIIDTVHRRYAAAKQADAATRKAQEELVKERKQHEQQ